MLELRLCGGVEVEVDGRVLPEALIGGRQGRLVLAYLACERDRAVRREELAELLWSEQLPESWAASLSAVISRLRRLFTEAGFDGSSVIASAPGAYQLDLPAGSRVDFDALVAAVGQAEDAAAAGERDRALAAASHVEAAAARGFLADDCEWVDGRRAAIRDMRVRAAIAESVAHLNVGASGRAVDAARRAVEFDGSMEAAYRQLMVALAAAGERAEALRVWERCRITLVEELGIDPSPETEAVYLRLLDGSSPAPLTTELPSGVVTFLLTDIVESSALWEEHATAMATALERHDAIVGAVVGAHGGTLLKAKLEGDATISVFARATEGAAAALALLDAMESEPWPEGARPRLRMAMHTGEAFERGGDYFGPALNRAARLRSLAAANEVLLSQAVAELVRDHLPTGVVLRDRGLQSLRGLSRGENVFELTRAAIEQHGDATEGAASHELTRPPVPTTLAGTGPFVGRGDELTQLTDLWERTSAGEAGAVFVGGEPGVGKSRLAGEIAQRAYSAGGLVLYGRCDEDLAAPLQPFIEAVRMLAPALGATRLRAVRGVDELTRVLPELTELLGDKPGVRADPDTERLALFDAVTQLLAAASNAVPVLLVLDDLHWAGKTTLSLLRHLLRGVKGSRLLVVGTYRDTELARTHPLAETLADLRRDTDTHRMTLGGLAEADVAAYLAAIGNTDRALGRELAEVTAGNPFFLIEVVRHVEESGGAWQPGTLPEGVREATGRRLSRLSDAANDALAVAAVVGTTFDLALVEQVRGVELVDPIGEAVRAGLVVEEPGSLARFRFAHAIVRQVLLSELVSLKRVRLHRTIAELLEAAPPATDQDARLADLAYHWFECASAGSADRAVAACRRAADRAVERLAYEEAGDLYGMALQALEWIDEADAETGAALHLARCDALLTAGDVAGARDAIDALEPAAAGSERLAAWYTTYEGLLAVLGEPDRLTEIVQSIAAAADAMRDAGDLAGEAKARYVHASALERLGQIGAAQRALDAALAAARTSGDRRLADAILAEAPVAALWGPSPVMRASGDCLDVVRVLRITSGTRAVEAVALRCQAVLEALRGRMDAARRMIGSSRRTVEQLGLTHRRLEAEVAAGLIELLDGEAATAEEHLRSAYEGLRERGLGGEAAQAAAFLGRALLLQDRVDEADEVASEAEALAGSDLRAAITWRDVRAVAAARRGDTERALALAREAVELASATDALLLVADARLALAAVLRAAGDVAAADAEALRALEAGEAKGATVIAALARRAMSGPIPTATPPRPVAASRGQGPTPNLAMAAAIRTQEAFNRGDWAAIQSSETQTWKLDDRRPIVGMTVDANDRRSEQLVHQGGGRLDPPELLATRGDRAVLCKWLLRGPGMEVPYLGIITVDIEGRIDRSVMFGPDAIDEAMAALDALGSQTAFENDATRTAARIHAAFAAHDWDALRACYADEWVQDDHRSVVATPLDREQSIASLRVIFEGRGKHEGRKIVATRGRTLALTRSTFRIPDPETAVPVLILSHVDDAGRYVRSTLFDPADIDGAIAELDRLFLETEGAEHADVVRLWASLNDAITRGDAAGYRALLAPEFVGRLHHLAREAEELTASEWIESSAQTVELFAGSAGRVEHIVNLSGHGGLWATVITGEHGDSGPFELRHLSAVRVASGFIVSIDVYDPKDVDAAVAALDPRPEAEPFENDATRTTARVHAAFAAHDWDAYRAYYADEWTQDDRRSLLAVPLDRDQSLAGMRFVFDGGATFTKRETIATRGRTCALTRTTLRVPEPEATYPALIVSCVDDAGRYLQSTMFDAEDIDGAIAELDRLFLEGEAAEHADVLALAESVFAALGRHDDAALGPMLAPEFVVRSHRVIRPSERLTASEWLADLDAIDTPSVPRVDHIAHLAGDGGLWVVTFHGHLEDGGRFATPVIMALRIASGVVVSLDAYDEHDADRALATLDAQRAPKVQWFENDAWRAALRFSAVHNRRDWQGYLDALDPGYAFVDRRRSVQMRLEGDEALATARVLFAVDDFSYDRTLIATRGEHLAMTRDRIVFVDGDAGPSDVETLSIVECNGDGRIVMTTGLDPDDLGAAYDALDARYVELGGGRFMNVMRESFDARDWETFGTLFVPGCTFVDNRTAGWGIVDIDTFVDYQRSIVALAPDARLWNDHVRRYGNVHMSAGRAFGSHEGGAREIAFVTVGMTDSNELLRHVENYDVTDTAIALARFEELVAEETGNVACRAGVRVRDALNRRDWQAFLDTLDPAFVTIDHRHGARLRLEGDEALDAYRVLLALDDFRHDISLLATRGDCLALRRIHTTFVDGQAGPSEVVSLSLLECSTDGLILSHTVFNPEDEDAAHAALEARHTEIVAEEEGNAAWRTVKRGSEALNRRDWPSFLATRDPAYVFVDNRHAVGMRLEGDDALNPFRVMIALDDFTHERALLATRGERLALTRVRVRFVDGQAGPSEVAGLAIVECNADGLIVVNTALDLDDLDAAYAALDARHAEMMAEATGNAAWRAAVRVCGALNRRDWQEFIDLLDPNIVNVFHGHKLRMAGNDALDSYRVLLTLDEFRFERTLLAARGERLALTQDLVTFRDGEAGPSEVAAFNLYEVDERGLVIRIDGFVEDDLAAAYAALDARHTELEAAQPRPNRAWDVLQTHVDAFTRRDSDRWVACLHPELVYDDRRSRGVAGEFVAADAIASLHTMFDMDEATCECRLVATVGDRVVLYESHMRGSDGAVGEIEVSALDIVEIGEDGRITHLIAFDPDSLDRALAELNARAAAVEPRLNRAARVVAEQDDAFARRDWEGIAGP